MSRASASKPKPAPEEPVEVENGETDEAEQPSESAVPGLSTAPRTERGKESSDARQDAIRQRLFDQMQEDLAKMGIRGQAYKYELRRVKPRQWRLKSGKVVHTQGLLETYKGEIPELDDIQLRHGAGEYTITPRGPDPETGRNRTFPSYDLDTIIDPEGPKTYSTPDGAMDITDADKEKAVAGDLASSITSLIGGMQTQTMEVMRSMLDDNRTQTRELLSARNAVPMIDPNIAAREERAEAQRKRDHEMALAKLAEDAKDRREEQARQDRLRAEADAKAEKARAEAMAAAEKERDRQHQKDMALLTAEMKRRDDEAKDRRDEQKAMQTAMEASRKETVAMIEKITDKLSKKTDDSDPLDQILKLREVQKALMPEEEDKGTQEINGAIAQSIAKLPDKVDGLLTKFMGMKEREAAQKKPKPFKADTVAVIDTDAETLSSTPTPRKEKPAPAPEPAEPAKEPAFEWANDDDDLVALGKKIGTNVEAALNADWLTDRIFKDMVLRFPESIRDVIAKMPTDEVTKLMEENAPVESSLRSARGRACIRRLHGFIRGVGQKPPAPAAEA